MAPPHNEIGAKPERLSMAAILTPELASRFARIALGHVTREYPNKPGHILRGPHDARTPRELHPLFFGSFDWHSCVHGYWLLCRLYRRFPELPERGEIRLLLERQFTPENVAAELSYFEAADGFERPYGWAWLLMLASELELQADAAARRCGAALAPLAEHIAARWLAFLPVATYPVRSGAHFNSAFAATLTWEYAGVFGNDELKQDLRDKTRAWFERDADCQVWEPSGDDFLSPALIEAVGMQRISPAAEFADWFDRFLPRMAARSPATLFEPAIVSDRADGKIAHLDGLNFSRAWCWRSLATSFAENDRRRARRRRGAHNPQSPACRGRLCRRTLARDFRHPRPRGLSGFRCAGQGSAPSLRTRLNTESISAVMAGLVPGLVPAIHVVQFTKGKIFATILPWPDKFMTVS
jgi:hypothetical protein